MVFSTIYQQYFSYFVAVSFTDRGIFTSWRKPQTCCKSLTNLTLYRVHFAIRGFKLTTLVVIGTDYIGSCNSNYHTIMTTTAPVFPSPIAIKYPIPNFNTLQKWVGVG